MSNFFVRGFTKCYIFVISFTAIQARVKLRGYMWHVGHVVNREAVCVIILSICSVLSVLWRLYSLCVDNDSLNTLYFVAYRKLGIKYQ